MLCAAGNARRMATLHAAMLLVIARCTGKDGQHCNGALCPPARMAALTAEGFLAAALVGAFLRMTTWSQS